MKYRVYKCTPTGTPVYDTTSRALGDGSYEMSLIRQAHGLLPGDIVHINTYWRILDADGVTWRYLEEIEDGQRFGGMRWGPAAAQRLYTQADKAEEAAHWTEGEDE